MSLQTKRFTAAELAPLVAASRPPIARVVRNTFPAFVGFALAGWFVGLLIVLLFRWL